MQGHDIAQFQIGSFASKHLVRYQIKADMTLRARDAKCQFLPWRVTTERSGHPWYHL